MFVPEASSLCQAGRVPDGQGARLVAPAHRVVCPRASPTFRGTVVLAQPGAIQHQGQYSACLSILEEHPLTCRVVCTAGARSDRDDGERVERAGVRAPGFGGERDLLQDRVPNRVS